MGADARLDLQLLRRLLLTKPRSGPLAVSCSSLVKPSLLLERRPLNGRKVGM